MRHEARHELLLEISFLLLVTDWCYILATKVINTPDFSVLGFKAFVHFDPMQILCLLPQTRNTYD